MRVEQEPWYQILSLNGKNHPTKASTGNGTAQLGMRKTIGTNGTVKAIAKGGGGYPLHRDFNVNSIYIYLCVFSYHTKIV